MNVYGYVRVSTEGQAVEGVSLEAQSARIAAWCQANGHTLIRTFEDRGISGKRQANRPGLTEALAAACKSKGAVVVYSLSRLARSTQDALSIAERLRKANANLVSLSESLDTTTAAGKLMFTVFSAVAQLESDLASERTRAALAHLKAKGQRVGQLPFGYRLAEEGSTRLVEDASEQFVLARIATLRAAGRTWHEVAESLNAHGYRTKTGKPWSLQTTRAAGITPATPIAA